MTECSTAALYGRSLRTLENIDPEKMDEDIGEITDLIIKICNDCELLKEKPELLERFNLPADPRTWDSSQLKIWISQFLNNCDIKNAGEVIDKLEKSSINGATLASMEEADFKRLFGVLCGDIMYYSFKRWVDDFKKNQIVPNTEYHALGTNMTEGYDDRHVPTFTPLENMDHKLEHTLTGMSSSNSDPVTMFDNKYLSQLTPSPVHLHSPGYGYSTDESSSDLSSPNYFWPNQPREPRLQNDLMTHTHCNFHYTPWLRSPGSIGDGSESEGSVTFDQEPNVKQLYRGYPKHEPNFDHQNQASGEMVVPVIPPKRKRGRPKKIRIEKPKRMQPILYKFILLQLDDPESRSHIEWVNKSEGVFKFHSAHKEEFAKKWGKYKRNREPMTYQNMARALRNYTKGKRKVMERVKRKLHYKFCVSYVPT